MRCQRGGQGAPEDQGAEGKAEAWSSTGANLAGPSRAVQAGPQGLGAEWKLLGELDQLYGSSLS